MGYSLYSFICNQVDVNVILESFDSSKEVKIEQGLCLVPMTDDFFDQINNYDISASIEGFKYLTKNIETKILKISRGKKIAYVEADYFGGTGGQNAIIWCNYKRQAVFEYGQEIINKVLKDFGVKCKWGKDEFETLGLGKNKNTIDWL